MVRRDGAQNRTLAPCLIPRHSQLHASEKSPTPTHPLPAPPHTELKLLAKIKEDKEVAGSFIISGVERDVYSSLGEVVPLR